LGAVVIEKHFTLRRADGGVDAAFSLEPEELKQLVIETERAWLSLGGIHYGPTEAEVTGRTRRRSLYVVADMQKGDLLTPANLRAIRPGLGLSPKFQDIVLGMRVSQTISAGTPLSWSLLKD
jgi:N-acetylneuraminate synthase